MGHIESNADLGQLIDSEGHVTTLPGTSRDRGEIQQDVCRHELQRQSERTASYPHVRLKSRDTRKGRQKYRRNTARQQQQRSDCRQVLICKDPNVPEKTDSVCCQQSHHTSLCTSSSVSRRPLRTSDHVTYSTADITSPSVDNVSTGDARRISQSTPTTAQVECQSLHDEGAATEDESDDVTEVKQSGLVALLSGDEHVVLSPRHSLLIASDSESESGDRSEHRRHTRDHQQLLPDDQREEQEESLSPSHCALDRFSRYRRVGQRRLYRSGELDRGSSVERFPALVRTYSAPQLSARSLFYGGLRETDVQELAASCGLISLSPSSDSDLSRTVDQITSSLSRVCCDVSDRATVLTEKSQLQRALLYLECVHGRPSCQRDRDIVRPLYERYRFLKRHAVSLSSPRECASKELTTIMEHETLSLPRRCTSVSSDGMSTSPAPGDRRLPRQQQQQQSQEQSNFNNMSPEELRQQLAALKEEKLRLNSILTKFESGFSNKREARMDSDREMQSVYAQHRHVRAQLKLVHVLLSKSLHRSSL